VLFLSAFVVRRVVLLWIVLAGGGALMACTASWIQSLLMQGAA
jgi:hypothetical protein